MKKLLYLIAAGVLAGAVASCDNEPKNPGDFNLKPEITLSDIVSLTSGDVYALKVAKTMDSIFGSNVTVWDTIYDENGEYLDRQSRDVWVPSQFTTRYVEYEAVSVPALADTFQINITTNAKWLSPQPTKPRGGSQFYNDATTGGGGDGVLIFRSENNNNAARTVPAEMNIYSSDSTMYLKVLLLQDGLR